MSDGDIEFPQVPMNNTEGIKGAKDIGFDPKVMNNFDNLKNTGDKGEPTLVKDPKKDNGGPGGPGGVAVLERPAVLTRTNADTHQPGVVEKQVMPGTSKGPGPTRGV